MNNKYKEWIVNLFETRITITELLNRMFESYSLGYEELQPKKNLELLLQFCIDTNEQDTIILEYLFLQDDVFSEIKEMRALLSSVDLNNMEYKEIRKLNESIYYLDMIFYDHKKHFISTEIFFIIKDNWEYIWREKCVYRLLAILTREHCNWSDTVNIRCRLLTTLVRLYQKCD